MGAFFSSIYRSINMAVHPHAGKLPTFEMLCNIPELMSSYYTLFPTMDNPEELVSFGTSGHRGTSLKRNFNEEHIYAISQAVCDYRKNNGITGPLFLGFDTHALSEAAYRSALEVIVANNVQVFIAKDGAFTPTPIISHAILNWNYNNPHNLADGIVITPSHNPPQDGGFKYNPPHGGPAESSITKKIEERANELLSKENKDVQLMYFNAAQQSDLVREYDMMGDYINDLENVLDMQAISQSGIKLGVDPLGGASLALWEPIAERYKLNLNVVNKEFDPTFRFVPCDKDGKIRMDCSSRFAMNNLLNMKDQYDLAFGCDPDADRHGIVTPTGLMNPNHYLAAVTAYLFKSRPHWDKNVGIGKTLVTSAMLDRIGESLGKKIVEVPVGFKWFVPYLQDGSCGLGCEESAGASILRKDGRVWTTDKDGIMLSLLAAEMTAKGHRPDNLYAELVKQHGEAFYERLDAPANEHTRNTLLSMNKEQIKINQAGDEDITQILTTAPGNDAAIGGVKIVTKSGWFAIRPSGTENICKVYAESFKSKEHLASLQQDAIELLEVLVK